MDCSGRRDEFYQHDDFCPIPEFFFRAMAFVNFVVLTCLSVTTAIQISGKWQRSRVHSRWFWACAFTLLGCIFTFPLQVGRLFHARHDHGIAASTLCSIGWCLVVVSGCSTGFGSFYDGVRLVFALGPQKVESWKSFMLKIWVACLCGHGLSTIPNFLALTNIMTSSEMWRQGFITAFWILSLISDTGLATVALMLHLEVNVLLKSVPPEAPRKIYKVLHAAKQGGIGTYILVCIKMALALLVIVWPDGWKISGFLCIYVWWPVFYAFSIFITWPSKHRRNKSRAAAQDAKSQPGFIRSLISKGGLLRQALRESGATADLEPVAPVLVDDADPSPPKEEPQNLSGARLDLEEEWENNESGMPMLGTPEFADLDKPVTIGKNNSRPSNPDDVTRGESQCSTWSAGEVLHMHSAAVHELPPVWERGVSLEFLEAFAQDYDVQGLTTDQVCERYIKPETIETTCSVWETIWTASENDFDSTSALIGTPTCMVSHAWLYQFTALMDIIRNYVKANSKGQGQHGRTEYFFLDMFSMNQHSLEAAKSEASGCSSAKRQQIEDRLLEELTKSISTPGKVLLALDPWRLPIPLTRCWCLYEVYIARQENCSLEIYFSTDAENEFVSDLQANEHALEDLFSRVDARHAQATVAVDREMILNHIDQHIGMDAFNQFIQETLRSSLKMIAMQWWASKI